MILNIDQYHFFGTSVRGPLHRMLHLPNQDAWLGRKNKSGIWICVSDGMGSRPNSRVGAQAACKAVQDAVRIWSKIDHAPAHFLIRLVRVIWETKVSSYNPRDCATTCLLACVLSGDRVVVGGIGDGLAVLRNPDDTFVKVVSRTSGFSNQTAALGDKHMLEDWLVYDADSFASGSIIFLATDGIADDLDENRISEFVEWIKKEHCDLPPRQRNLVLNKMLTQWPTPKHQDDKTISVIYRS